MAKIIQDSARTLIIKFLTDFNNQLYNLICTFCKTVNETREIKSYPEELTYIVSRGLEHVSFILTCTTLHSTHIPSIIRNINSSIHDLMEISNIENKDYKTHYELYAPEAFLIFIAIMKNFGLGNLLDQSKYYIENLTPLIWDWDNDFNDWLTLTEEQKNRLKEYFTPESFSPNDSISQEIYKILILERTSQAASNYMQEEAYVSFVDIINSLDDSHREHIIALKDFINDTIDEAELSSKIKEKLKKQLKDKARIIKLNTPPASKVINTKEYVVEKNVQTEIGNVEAGGIGAQITKENNQ